MSTVQFKMDLGDGAYYLGCTRRTVDTWKVTVIRQADQRSWIVTYNTDTREADTNFLVGEVPPLDAIEQFLREQPALHVVRLV